MALLRHLALLALLNVTVPLCASPVALGRFAQPSLTGEGVMGNLSHNVVVERGFKLNYLANQRLGERWGATTFTGFVTLLLNDEVVALSPAGKPTEGSRTLFVSPTLGRYAKEYGGDWGRAGVQGESALGMPLARFSADFTAGKRPLTAKWLITGFDWAGQPAPQRWAWWSKGALHPLAVDPATGAVALPTGPGYLLAWSDGQPYTLALLPAERPARVAVGKQGITVSFGGGTAAAGQAGRLPDLYVAPLECRPSPALLRLLPEMATPAAELVMTLGWVRGKPYAQFARQDGRRAPIALPPPYRPRGDAWQETPLGRVTFVRSGQASVELPLPPNLQLLVKRFRSLPPDELAAVEADVREILACQQPDGQFTFSLGRPFYDGQTAGVLIQLAPVVGEELRGQVQAAVRKTLDYWWGRLEYDDRTAVWLFPEPSDAPAVVDYPEITATLLYPTAAYAELVDRGYATARWPQVAKVAGTIGRGYDPNGTAWAHAGPEYVHVLTESTVGGYLAYASLHHLARLAGNEQEARAFAARAAWAYAAMGLYRYRPEYGRGGILSQIFADGLFVEPALAWDYTMFTWFSWCPLWSLPQQDEYHLWEVLKQVRWWEYYRGSRQLAYDWCHYTALVRFGDVKEAESHYPEILGHAPSRDNFDTVALYRPLARCWRQEMLSTAAR